MDDFEFKYVLVYQVIYDIIFWECKCLIYVSLVNVMEFLYKEWLEEYIYCLVEYVYLG